MATNPTATRLRVRRSWPWPDLGAAVPGHTIEEPAVTEEVRVRLDTGARTLAAAGATLEHLAVEVGPGSWREVWTLELPEVGDPATPRVWEAPLAEVPEEALRLLRGLSRGRALVEVDRHVATRHTHRLVDRKGHLVATVVDTTDDTGHRRRRRVEVVGVAGRTREGRRLARALRRHGAVPEGPRSARPAPPERRHAPTTALDVAAATIGDGLGRLLAHDPHLRAGGHVEAVHQARVATRRLRSDLRSVADVLDPEATGHLREELRWLGARLGAVRDADVLEGRLLARDEGDPALPGLAGLLGALRQERADAMAELAVTLDSPRYLALLDELAAAAARPPQRRRRSHPIQPVPPSVPGWARRRPAVKPGAAARTALPALVRRPWRRLRADVRSLPAVPTDGELHDVRIRAKELRYAAELAAPLLGRRAGRLAARAKALQTVLGDHHDAVVTESWLRQQAAGATAEVAFAAGVLVAEQRAEQGRLRASWRGAWLALAAERRGWLEH